MFQLVLAIFNSVPDKFLLQYMGSNTFKEPVIDLIVQCISYKWSGHIHYLLFGAAICSSFCWYSRI